MCMKLYSIIINSCNYDIIYQLTKDICFDSKGIWMNKLFPFYCEFLLNGVLRYWGGSPHAWNHGHVLDFEVLVCFAPKTMLGQHQILLWWFMCIYIYIDLKIYVIIYLLLYTYIYTSLSVKEDVPHVFERKACKFFVCIAG